MPKTRVQKEQTVTELTEKLKSSKSVVLTDYKGLTMSQLSDLRNKLRDQEAQLLVTKNTLLDISLKQAGMEVADSTIKTGPTATLFAYDDEISPIKTLTKIFKDTGIGKVKGGFLNGQFLDAFSITRLANLPGKQQLRGQVVGLINAPLQGMVTVLQGNLRNLVYALDQIRKSKGGE
ncbi:MAG: 50S ribosomal protein L10 [Patescibacteria group bacterium]|nr:50S ribosomal protein L10 [Patescibacteria group bacterium]